MPPGLAFYDKDQRLHATLGTAEGFGANLALRGPEGREQVLLGVNTDGAPYLRLSDRKGKLMWKAP